MDGRAGWIRRRSVAPWTARRNLRSIAPWTARRNPRSIAAAWPAERPAMDGRAGWIRKMDVAPWMAQRSSTKAAPSRDRPKPGHGIDWRDGAERLGVSPRKIGRAHV